MEELWDISRVAEYLGVSERTVYNRVRTGELPALKVGRLWRVRPSELEEWLASGHPSRASAPGPYPYESATEPVGAVAEGAGVPGREALELLLDGLDDPLERRLTFVGLLSAAVQALGWPAPIVVGGHAVEYYTAGGYVTMDIDLAGASEPVAQVLTSWGFARQGRHWFDEDLKLVVEVPGSGPDSATLEHVTGVHIGRLVAYVIGIEDLIVDRLCAAKYWRDSESLMWAEALLVTATDLDIAYLDHRAAEEDVLDELKRLRQGRAL